MPLTLQEIIEEAATLVPNDVPIADQVLWLNAIHNDFFNVVKIPVIATFPTIKGVATYVANAQVQERNIDYVTLGVLKYISLYEDEVSPLQNQYGFDDMTNVLTLYPAPYKSGLNGIIRYRRIVTITFSSSNLGVSPEIPDEWQWTMIPALAAYLANTQDDAAKAGNYETQYKQAWNVAAANYTDGTVAV